MGNNACKVHARDIGKVMRESGLDNAFEDPQCLCGTCLL